MAAGRPGLGGHDALQGTWRGSRAGSPGSDERARTSRSGQFDKMTMTDANPDQKSTKEGPSSWTRRQGVRLGRMRRTAGSASTELRTDDFKFYAVPMAAGETSGPRVLDDKGGQLFVLKRYVPEPKGEHCRNQERPGGFARHLAARQNAHSRLRAIDFTIFDSRHGEGDAIMESSYRPKTQSD